MARFRYVGPGGGGAGRGPDEAGVVLFGGWCAEPTTAPPGFNVVRAPHGHAVGTPCAVLRRGATVLNVPDAAAQVSRHLRAARGVNRRTLYQEMP